MNNSHPTDFRPSPIVADVHLHTCHSHGQAEVRAMYEAARARGLAIIGFSEHSPRPEGYAYPEDYQEKLAKGFPRYLEEVRQMGAVGKDQGISVLLGLEADYIPGREDFSKALLETADFDYCIGGLHFQKTWGFDFSPEDWVSLSEEERFNCYYLYYQDLTTMCQSGLFHIAAHPDLIKLFSVQSFHAWLETPEAEKCLREALTAMKDNAVIMEVSSAGLRKPCREIYPCGTIMRLAAELHLPISFASDAHCVNTPAFAFAELARYAAEYGYTHSVVVEQGRPRSIPFASA